MRRYWIIEWILLPFKFLQIKMIVKRLLEADAYHFIILDNSIRFDSPDSKLRPSGGRAIFVWGNPKRLIPTNSLATPHNLPHRDSAVLPFSLAAIKGGLTSRPVDRKSPIDYNPVLPMLHTFPRSANGSKTGTTHNPE
jgi:hypothetical protein